MSNGLPSESFIGIVYIYFVSITQCVCLLFFSDTVFFILFRVPHIVLLRSFIIFCSSNRSEQPQRSSTAANLSTFWHIHADPKPVNGGNRADKHKLKHKLIAAAKGQLLSRESPQQEATQSPKKRKLKRKRGPRTVLRWILLIGRKSKLAQQRHMVGHTHWADTICGSSCAAAASNDQFTAEYSLLFIC